jgi:hypothetical protein
MKRVALASLTAGLMLSVAPAIAQMQQKEPDSGGTPQMQRPSGGQSDSGTSRPGAEKSAEPKAKANTGKDTAQGKEPSGKGTAQSEPKSSKGTANEGIEPKGKASKGTAEKSPEPKDKATKGTAQKSPEPKDSATKGTAQKSPEPKDNANKGTAQKSPEPKDSATKGAQNGSAGRTQVSEQQKPNIGQTLHKERNLNRVTNVNFSINVGTRIPHSVRLVALPASVIAIVPSYRAYRYFAVGEQICIVDPASFEIVDVIVLTNETAMRGDSRGSATLVLSDTERDLVLREIDMRDGSTLGLGALSEGADVPRGVQLRVFSSNVVDRVPKLRDYKFFTAENRLAIVDPQGGKVQLLIDGRR